MGKAATKTGKPSDADTPDEKIMRDAHAPDENPADAPAEDQVEEDDGGEPIAEYADRVLAEEREREASLEAKKLALLATIVLVDETTQRSHKQAVALAHIISERAGGEESIAISAARLVCKQPDGMSPGDAVEIARKLVRLSGELLEVQARPIDEPFV